MPQAPKNLKILRREFIRAEEVAKLSGNNEAMNAVVDEYSAKLQSRVDFLLQSCRGMGPIHEDNFLPEVDGVENG